jgi:hypothetical protein
VIVTRPKPLEEILAFLKSFRKVLVLGCRGCVAVYHVGGDKEARELASELSKRGIEASSKSVLRQCDLRYLEDLKEELSQFEAVLSLACGVGVVSFAEMFPEIPVYPGVDTLFCGSQIGEGVFQEKCRACGNCLLHLTAGLCPVALCPKGLLNGPCGGSSEGKCEVNQDKPCVWEEIIKRLEKQGRLEELLKLFPARDYSLAEGSSPREYLHAKGEK